MKRMIILTLCCCLAACEGDFDEVKDTRQRHVTFDFNTDLLFSEYLEIDGEDFLLNSIDALPSDKRVRITTYCYDEKDSLIYRQTQFYPLNQYRTCKIRHLDKDITYSFLFIADVVNYTSDDNYMETWFHIKTKTVDEFYLYSDQRKEHPAENVVGSAFVKMVPDNNNCSIEFHPLTYNGYIVLDNTDQISLVEGFVSYTVSFRPTTMEKIYYGTLGYEFKHVSPQEKTIVMPVTLCNVDDIIKATITLHKLGISKEISLIKNNDDHRPFVARFDCNTMTLTDYETY